ncbi:hypothetical protein [Nitrogeniibacter aestuarii]|uniref:hypothetical protein n=1 Tax=Nitrogeniibacter aestuarii TaxID=2815343 RepID=UPI001D118B23|nr:hypothetical protein [Nitrogeniibacter aestuarii]
MIAQALVKEHQIESIDHLHAYGQLSVDTIEKMMQLSLQHARDSFDTQAERAQTMLSGSQPSPVQVDTAVSVLQSAMQVFTNSYEKWVDLLNAQLATIQRTAHASYEDLQRWSPAGTEVMVEAAELMTQAVEESAELAAEAGASMLKTMEQSTTAVEKKPVTRRRVAVKKTA